MTVLTGGKAFFDTNVLLYMHSSADPGKQERAQALFQRYNDVGRIVLSSQVVQEFYSVGLRKLALSREQVKQVVTDLLDFPLVLLGPSHILSAIEHEERYQISFWDALILAAAESGGAEVLYIEGLNHGQQYGSVMVRNSFKEG